MWFSQAKTPLVVTETKEVKNEVLVQGKTKHFKIETNLGYFDAALIPFNNTWTLTVDFQKAISDVEMTGSILNRQEKQKFFKRAVKLAEDIQGHYNLETKTDSSTLEKVELTVNLK